jgi:hypothetical protein
VEPQNEVKALTEVGEDHQLQTGVAIAACIEPELDGLGSWWVLQGKERPPTTPQQPYRTEVRTTNQNKNNKPKQEQQTKTSTRSLLVKVHILFRFPL